MDILFESVLLAGPTLSTTASSCSLYRYCKRASFTPDAQSIPARLAQESPDLLIVEDDSASRCLEILPGLREKCPGCRVIFVLPNPDVVSVVGLMSAGAHDCARGPLGAEGLEELLASMGNGVAPLRRTGLFFDEQCHPKVGFVGKSAGVARLLETLRVVATSRCNPILITGPTGTGKELAAMAAHYWRGNPGRFLGVNCAALTTNLLESELFGHLKGAFTGADRDKTGLLEAAADGSLFLDEISEMSPDLQAKLLRVLQENTFRKVGSTADIPSSATIIASSNRNLMEEVKKGAFRQDLYYRLAVFPIALPPLGDSDRREDIELLANYFIATSKISDYTGFLRLGEGARRKLMEHNWPGNVRELKNVIDRARILARSEEIGPSHIIIDRPDAEAPPAAPAAAGAEDFSLESAEREFIVRALREANWQRTRAAGLLGITRATLHAKIKRYEIRQPEIRGGLAHSENAPTP